MQLFFMGGEQSTNLRLLTEAGATSVGLSFHSLVVRLPKTKPYVVADRFPGMAVYLSSGGHTLTKKTDAEVSEYIDRYESFLRANADALAFFTPVEDPRAGLDHLLRLADISADRKLVPVSDGSLQHLNNLGSLYPVVGVRGAMTPTLSAAMVSLRNRFGTEFFLLDTARPEDLVGGRFSYAATTGWLGPMRNGETIVWDGHRLVRYNARQQDIARGGRHRALFTQAGFDPDRIMEGDYRELTRLAVWSYRQLESSVDRPKPPINPFDPSAGTVIKFPGTEPEQEQAGTDLAEVDHTPPVVRNEPQAPRTRNEPRQVMPGFSVEAKQALEFDDEGNQIVVERLLAKKGTASIRACNTCHVAANCPAFRPDSECAYALPVEIRTREQLQSAMAAILERQMETVAFMYMQQDLNGGYADPNTGLEVDRLFKMIETMKRLDENREYTRLTVERSSSAASIMSVFGEQARKLQELDSPVQGTDIDRRLYE